MNATKQNKDEIAFPDDLERNPGIGQSKGTFATGESPESIEGENTVEGDVENDSTMTDGVPQHEEGRTNRERTRPAGFPPARSLRRALRRSAGPQSQRS